jgi:hypothetical protein
MSTTLTVTVPTLIEFEITVRKVCFINTSLYGVPPGVCATIGLNTNALVAGAEPLSFPLLPAGMTERGGAVITAEPLISAFDAAVDMVSWNTGSADRLACTI